MKKEQIFAETQSRNTLENMVFSKKIIDSVNPHAKVAYATTNYHVFRSGIYAIQAGLDAEGIASETKWYFWPNGFVREFIAILRDNKRAHLIVVFWVFLLCLCIFGWVMYYLG